MKARTVTITLAVAGSAGAFRVACKYTSVSAEAIVTSISQRRSVIACHALTEAEPPRPALAAPLTPNHFKKNMDASSTIALAPTIHSPGRSRDGSKSMQPCLCLVLSQDPGGGVDPPVGPPPADSLGPAEGAGGGGGGGDAPRDDPMPPKAIAVPLRACIATYTSATVTMTHT